MRTLAIYSIKGGVGKTASAVTLAHVAAAAGYRTLLWDLDPQGAATYYFRIKPRGRRAADRLLAGKRTLDSFIKASDYPNLDLVPASFSYRNLDLKLNDDPHPHTRLRRLLASVADDYDLAILDCAPSISLVSENVFRAAEALVVPTIPTVMSLNTLGQLLRHLKGAPHAPRVLPFFCMLDSRRSMHREIQATWLEKKGRHAFLETAIPYSSIVEQMSRRREPLTAYGARTAPGKAYADLWLEIENRLDLSPPGASVR